MAPNTAHLLRLWAQAPYGELLFGHKSDGKMPLGLIAAASHGGLLPR